MMVLFAETALTPTGWARDVRLTVAADGSLAAVEPGGSSEGAERLSGPVLPGMPNLHSHAFQRAMAGLAERSSGAEDSFWTWRKAMYGLVARIGPEELRAVAAQLYVEMLKAGYTAVAEFHYLHHDRDGTPYADCCELAEAVLAAAAASGIGMTLLPVLYQSGGFGGAPAEPGQRRFLNRPDALAATIAELRRRHGADSQVRIGVAPHSIRAVLPEGLREITDALRAMDSTAPVHIHIAEQTREVEECIAWSGQRSVAWLLDHVDVDARWCLVHATHVDSEETRSVAKSGAVAGLCPTTEGNLGDGFFPLPAYLDAGGAWGIGSDSHISVSPVEELRWLEYGQRLLARRRNVASAGRSASTGTLLWTRALAGGAQALGRPVGALAPGCRADLLVLDAEGPTLYGRRGDTLLDALVFAGNVNPVRHVMVGGRWVVRDARHIREAAIEARFRAVLDALDS